ncbi:gastrula zinc finger protein XlCGF17.1-like isoform X1 [Corythoichthys intestinalis]|uniref:gastrula zinc finger protein XlCGF17.1-like isoform X1 n=2 Tax=Corythoichthys intestinalis TaxID=161448 RepID=UPI0025A67AEB|nr:gastrula zinc finger protein XlCGF17.1-like isoform X1 [Corythoichthys intestinalis]
MRRGNPGHDECPTDVTLEDLHPENQAAFHVKQESDMPCIKYEAAPENFSVKEEHEDKTTNFPMTISVKSEEDDIESGAAKPSSNSSFQHLTTKGEGRSQPDGLLAPLSDSDDVTSHSSDFNTDEEDDDFDRNASKSLNKSSLTRNTKECAGGKPFACSVCDKRFTKKSCLDIHTTTHTGGNSFACSFCEKIFCWKYQLTRHTRMHTGEKPFACSLCSQRFTQKGHLVLHTRNHTGEKPFGCTLCDKRFSQKTYLDLHKRTHTGEKPFVCTCCGQRFTEKGTLNRHARTHTGEKPFACSFCEKKFCLKHQLTRHTQTHTGEKPFVCTYCGKRFALKLTLKRHTRTHTGEKPFVKDLTRSAKKGHLLSHASHTGESL